MKELQVKFQPSRRQLFTKPFELYGDGKPADTSWFHFSRHSANRDRHDSGKYRQKGGKRVQGKRKINKKQLQKPRSLVRESRH